MGSGKTTVGKMISKKLNIDFFDVDQEIENKTKQSIKDIFEKKGEIFFRKLEEKITLAILRKNQGVISLGGGAFLNRAPFALTSTSPGSIPAFAAGLSGSTRTTFSARLRPTNTISDVTPMLTAFATRGDCRLVISSPDPSTRLNHSCPAASHWFPEPTCR